MPRPGAGHVLLALTVVNLVNFADRSITQGAPEQFSAFVSVTLASEKTRMWLGAMFSSFIACYSIASIIFGHLLHTVPPFRLLSVGLSIWVCALATSGISYFLPHHPVTFWIFLSARAISGVGEAAFQIIVPPYIEDFAPPDSKSIWLGLFYTAIPLGAALGYGYGAALASSSLGWGWAYLFEAIPMAPCAIASAWLPSAAVLRARRDERAAARSGTYPLLQSFTGADSLAHEQHTSQPNESAIASLEELQPAAEANAQEQTGPASEGSAAPSVLSQVRWLVTSPTYVLLTMGYAAYTATVSAFATFAPLNLLALGVFSSQKEASLLFSVAAAVGGIVGTPIGGLLTDAVARRSLRRESPKSGSKHARLVETRAIVGISTIMVALGAAFFIGAALSLFGGRDKWPTLVCVCAGITLVYGTSSGITRAAMLLVPTHMRAFSIACMCSTARTIMPCATHVAASHRAHGRARAARVLASASTCYLRDTCERPAASPARCALAFYTQCSRLASTSWATCRRQPSSERLRRHGRRPVSQFATITTSTATSTTFAPG